MRHMLLRAARTAGASGAILAFVLQTTGCPEPPASDCSAKAMCAPPDSGTAMPASDASLDAGLPDGPIDEAADAPVVVPTACPLGTTHVCAPPVPAGFVGPVTFWIGKNGDTAPECPAGYPRAYDTYSNIDAGNAACTCACAAVGQQCVSQATIYRDSNCAQPCDPNIAVASCSPISTACGNEQGTLRASAPLPEGGTCVAQMTNITIPRATWGNTTRMCNGLTAGGDPAYYCEGAGSVCVPVVDVPYQTTPCIAKTVQQGVPVPTSCPAAYPVGPMVSYQSYNSFNDSRGCAACTCSPAPTGGTCAGSISVTTVDQGDCTTGAVSYPINTLGTGCVSYNLPNSIGNIGASYTLTPGACSIVTDTMPMGTVMPTGSAQIICCTL